MNSIDQKLLIKQSLGGREWSPSQQATPQSTQVPFIRHNLESTLFLLQILQNMQFEMKVAERDDFYMNAIERNCFQKQELGEAKGRRGAEGEKGRVEHEEGRVEHDSGKIKREELNVTQIPR